MAGYDNTNRGSIWKNDKKETDSHPDFKGTINVDGKEYWLSGWKRKEGGNPKAPALSLSVQAKEQASQGSSQQAQQVNQNQGGFPSHGGQQSNGKPDPFADNGVPVDDIPFN